MQFANSTSTYVPSRTQAIFQSQSSQQIELREEEEKKIMKERKSPRQKENTFSSHEHRLLEVFFLIA